VFFLLNVALGLIGFIVIDAFKVSLSKELANGSRGLLGADITVSCNNRLCTEDEIKIAKDTIKAQEDAHLMSLFSMASAGEKTRLAQVAAISPNFPLYGKIELKELKEPSAAMRSALCERQKVWVFP